jgi:hypothetical protein
VAQLNIPTIVGGNWADGTDMPARRFILDTVPYCCLRLQDHVKLADRTSYGQQSCKFHIKVNYSCETQNWWRSTADSAFFLVTSLCDTISYVTIERIFSR